MVSTHYSASICAPKKEKNTQATSTYDFRIELPDLSVLLVGAAKLLEIGHLSDAYATAGDRAMRMADAVWVESEL